MRQVQRSRELHLLQPSHREQIKPFHSNLKEEMVDGGKEGQAPCQPGDKKNQGSLIKEPWILPVISY